MYESKIYESFVFEISYKKKMKMYLYVLVCNQAAQTSTSCRNTRTSDETSRISKEPYVQLTHHEQ